MLRIICGNVIGVDKSLADLVAIVIDANRRSDDVILATSNYQVLRFINLCLAAYRSQDESIEKAWWLKECACELIRVDSDGETDMSVDMLLPSGFIDVSLLPNELEYFNDITSDKIFSNVMSHSNCLGNCDQCQFGCEDLLRIL